MKRIFKIIAIILSVLVILAVTASGAAYFFRDRLGGIAVKKINAYLNTPVDVGSVRIDLFRHYPRLTLELSDVKISESRKVLKKPLCTAGKIRVIFNILDLLANRHHIHSVYIGQGEFNMGLDSLGRINYHIFKSVASRKEDKTDTSGISLNIRRVTVEDFRFNYTSLQNGNQVRLIIPVMETRLSYRNDQVQVQVSGNAQSRFIRINGINYLTGEKTGLKSDFIYDLNKSAFVFEKSSVEINGYQYQINGRIGTGGDQPVDLKIETSGSDLKALTALLPEKYRNYLSPYESSGNVEFNGFVKGALASDDNPAVDFAFHCENVSLYDPELKKNVRRMSLKGHFTNGPGKNFRTSKLEIKNVSGDLEGRAFSGEIEIHDFDRVFVDMDLTAGFDLGTLLHIFPVKNIISGSGELLLNIKAAGAMYDSSGRKSARDMIASGDASLKNAELITNYAESSFKGLNGTFNFNNADLAIEDFRGKLGSSDFKISGFFKNIIPFLLLPNQPILVEADFESRFLNLNELLKVSFSASGQRDKSGGYHLDIPPLLDVRLKLAIRQVILSKFSAANVTGTLNINHQRAVIEEARMHTMGGTLDLSGSISSNDPVERPVLADGHLEGIHIDSIFYVFNNFNQNFLMDHHLRGEINADINTFLLLDKELRVDPKSLLSFINISIIHGELNDFEPMQKLSKYIDSESLKHLRFSELRNAIQIKDRVITIPEMDIISNVSTIRVSGTHTFDQHIDYHFRVPLSQFKNQDPDVRYGEIAESENGEMNVFLKMTGTTDDYRVSYDAKAVSRKIVQDLKKEGKEIKDLFKKKEEKTGTKVELEDEDYF